MYMYEEQKHLPKQIFETLSPKYLTELMAKRQGLIFIMAPVDLIANFGEAHGIKFFINFIIGGIRLNLSEPMLKTILIFKKYLEDNKIVRRLKQYRPQRRPLVDSELSS